MIAYFLFVGGMGLLPYYADFPSGFRYMWVAFFWDFWLPVDVFWFVMWVAARRQLGRRRREEILHSQSVFVEAEHFEIYKPR